MGTQPSKLALYLTLLLPAPALAAEGATPPAAEPSPSALLFGKKCGSCHSIGEGDRQGPDLKGVLQRRDKKWVAEFVRAPGAKIDGGDAVANELLAKFKGLRMPDQQLTDDELAGLLAYLDECTKAGGCKIVMGKVKHASEAKPDDIASGRALFDGSKKLEKGGAACISCHNVRGIGLLGGGTLAKDLTFAYARLNDQGMQSSLESTPFPIMKDVFAQKALTAAEAFQLKAFLYAASREGTQPRGDQNFLYLGIAGLFASLGLMGTVWGGRMKGVRKPLVHRAKTHQDNGDHA